MKSFYKSVIVPLFFMFLVGSCATGVISSGRGNMGEAKNNPFSFFSAGADIYLSFKSDFIKNTNLGKQGKLGKTEKKILSKTKIVNAALYKNNYMLSLEGNFYPVISSAFYFTFSSNWEKIKIKKTASYWKYKKAGSKNIYLAMTRKKVFLSSAPLFEKKENARIPPDYFEFSRDSEGSGWFSTPSIFNMFLSAAGISVQIPARSIFFAVFQNSYGYECAFRLEMPNAAAAKGIASLIIITRANMGDISLLDIKTRTILEIMFANPPQVKNNALYLTTGVMTLKDISLMLDFFLEQKQIF